MNIVKSNVLLDEPIPDLLCGVCQDVLDDPIQVRCPEDHIFCAKCIGSYVKQNTSCPLCMTPLDQTAFQPSKFVQRQIGRLRTRCLHHDAGCPWQGVLSDDHWKTCGFQPTECPNAQRGCTERVRQMDLESHTAQCAFEVLSCPNGMPLCKPFLRKDLPTHEKECRSYPCPYAAAGCSYVASAEEVNAHCDTYCGRLHKELESLRAECDTLRQRVAKLEKAAPATDASSSTKVDAADNAMHDIDLLQHMFTSDSSFQPYNMLDTKPFLMDPSQNNNNEAHLLNDFMDFSVCLPGASASTMAMDPHVGNPQAPFSPTLTSTSKPLAKDSHANTNNTSTSANVPVSAPKRAPNGKIIRYSKNTRLAHGALRMARQQTTQPKPVDPFEALLAELDVFGKGGGNTLESDSAKSENARLAAEDISSAELATLMAQQSLSSPDNSKYAFNGIEDVTQFLHDLRPPDNLNVAAPASASTPKSVHSPAPVPAPAPGSPSPSVHKDRQGESSQQQQEAGTPPRVVSERRVDPLQSSPLRSPQPTSPANHASPPPAGGAPKRRPMFVLASSYLSNYTSNNNNDSKS
ncbi:hypothetical protein BCR43DRAFT_481162 [Syncephalastrum racemosum]|uniref:RING-type domain-containing protein n=1 Tax=Syncephalastrum racemosum TaxID=13706 RepID=A0A1X2HRJ4_SYNRA|nr:hypothetical protein BCR43DRAFT_481162 [Syncephalastrum racemosum]